MRRIQSNAILGLLILVGALCSFSAFGQTTVLVTNNQTFRYLENGGDQGTAWRARTFNDSSWSTGATLIGYETAPYFEPLSTLLSDPATIGYPPTYYFRTTFNAPGTTPTNTIFYLTNWIDDGAVFYINGVEVARLRMPTGNIGYTNLASAGPATEGQTDVIRFGYTNFTLLASGNVLAVEVHQGSTNSSDIVLGTILAREIPIPLVITDQPDDLTVVSNAPAALAVTVTGTTPTYQWYKDGFSIANQTNATLTINNTRLSDAGNYHVIVRGSVNSVTSRVARLTIVRDTFGPELVSAIVQTSTLYSNKVDVRFSDANPLSGASANNTNNYTIATFPASTPIKVIGAQLSAGTVRLVIDQLWDYTKTYIITVTGVQDALGNAVRPKSQVGVQFTIRTNMFDMTSTPGGDYQYWMFHQDYETEPPNWKAANWVDDGTWGGPAPGVFYYDQNPWTPCTGVRSREVSVGYITYYFRTTFVLSNFSSTAVARMNTLFDDGAIIWLNGKEIHRVNLPGGPVTATTTATTDVAANPPPCALVTLNVTNLINGTNVLAVEVHQSTATTGYDIAMGLDLDLEYVTPAFNFPALAVTRSGNQLRVNWPGAPWKLETKTNLSSAAWTRLTATTNFFSTNVVNGRQQYFRVTQP